MKRLFLLLLLALFCPAGCASDSPTPAGGCQPTDDATRLDNPDDGYCVLYPNNSCVLGQPGSTTIVAPRDGNALDCSDPLVMQAGDFVTITAAPAERTNGRGRRQRPAGRPRRL